MPRRMYVVTFTLTAFLTDAGSAQQTDRWVRVHGVAYDSLRAAPLVAAVVMIVGSPGSTRTDAHGRFQFDSVSPGVHTFAAHHEALDSLGFTGISARAIVTDGREPVQIAVPSFATLWRVACGNARPPRDSGFIYGTVRDAVTKAPVPNAIVDLTWLALAVTKSNGVAQTRWRGMTRSDSSGTYGICGVPMLVGLRMLAATDSGSSGILDIIGTERRVQRRDLLVGPTDGTHTGSRGTVRGVVMDSAGRAISDARVIVDGAPELRSATDGQFVVRDVPTGTRQVEVLSLGMAPVVTTIDVLPNDTTAMLATMKKLTTLDVVRVTASPSVRRLVQELDERRKTGFGYLRDSTEIGNRGTLSAVFSEFAGTRVESRGGSTPLLITLASSRGGRCIANLAIDGFAATFDQLQFYRPSDIAAIEVYPHRFTVPPRFLRGNSECGAIIVWTKWTLH